MQNKINLFFTVFLSLQIGHCIQGSSAVEQLRQEIEENIKRGEQQVRMVNRATVAVASVFAVFIPGVYVWHSDCSWEHKVVQTAVSDAFMIASVCMGLAANKTSKQCIESLKILRGKSDRELDEMINDSSCQHNKYLQSIIDSIKASKNTSDIV